MKYYFTFKHILYKFIGLSYYVTNFIIFVQLLTFVNLLLRYYMCFVFSIIIHTRRGPYKHEQGFLESFFKVGEMKNYFLTNHTLQLSNLAIRLMFWVFKWISSVFHNSYLLHDAEWVWCYATKPEASIVVTNICFNIRLHAPICQSWVLFSSSFQSNGLQYFLLRLDSRKP